MKRTTQNKTITAPSNVFFNILTNDPSLTAWGWAVVNGQGEVIDCGCIKTIPEHKKTRIRKSDDTCRRASLIIQELLRIIRKYKIAFLLSEAPHGSQNASAAVMIGLVVGIIQTLADTQDLGIEWYSEQDAKKCLLGKKTATKDETIKAIRVAYNVKWTDAGYKNEAIADALAVYNAAKILSPTLRVLRR